jgi:gamma-glutamylcyclotransferase (GGCT)/AIG2-like uncharacterized protein YtfP
MPDPSAVFVYGTLKRGQVREKFWPRRPLRIEPATVRGLLSDLGPYPALVEGDNLVAGELWQFAAQDMPATLAALDEVEGCQGNSDDLYRRVVVQCRTAAGDVAAWSYFYGRGDEIARARPIPPGADGVCRWPMPAAARDA